MIIHKVRTRHNREGKAFAHLKFLVSLAIASIASIYPNFIKGILGSDSRVGFFYSIIALLSLLVTLYSTQIFQKFKRVGIVNLTLSLSVGVYIILTAISSFGSLFVIEIMRVFSIVLIGLSITLFVRDFSKEEELGESEAELFVFDNLGYFLGPLVAGFLAFHYGFDSVFFLAALLSLIAYSYFNHQYFVKKHKHIKNKITLTKGTVLTNAKDFFKVSENRKSFFIKFALEYWWATFYFYVPLFIINLGFTQKISGLVVGAVVLPLIFLEVFVGKLADKKGYKNFLSLGFFILSGVLILISYFNDSVFSIFLLILTSFGVTMIEPIQDLHFFKTVKKGEEDRLFGILMLSFPLSEIIAPSLAGLSLIFFGPSAVWLIVSIVSFSAFLVSRSLKQIN